MVLKPVISKLAGKLVVLASASPRRLEILRNAGLRFEVVPSWFKETIDKGLFKAPHEYAVETAKQKALEVARRMPFKHLKTPDIVIGADTIVAVDGKILEKPVDKCDAYRMLSSLSGKEHSVFTGVAIVLCHEKENEEVDYQLIDFYEETKVKFADLSEDMLWEYINSGEPMDKAGGYGIQALGGMLVEYVHGDFLNVVGFPLNHFCKQLDLIYNHWTPSSDQENASIHLSHNGTRSTSVLTQPPPKPPAQCNQSSSPSAKYNSSPSPRLNSPSASQTHNTQDSPSSSPVHKGERKDADSEVGVSSWRLVDSSSAKDKDAKLQGSESTTLQQIISRGHAIVPEHEDSEPKKENLQQIIELMDGFKASKALFTACNLGVFDLLKSKPSLDASQVAREIKASVKGTDCLLEACASLGLLRSKERPCQKPVYENTDLATRFLLSDAPLSLHGYIQHCNNTVWPLFSHLESAVREGTHQHEKAFGKKSDDVFQDTYCNSQEVKLRFMRAMHSIAEVTGAAVASAFDLSGYKTACDLGGCTGAMAYKFIKAHPSLSVTVFDLPAIVEMSEHFRPLHTDNRVSFVAGDFFKDELPKADLYILARILHDWSDEKVHILLRKIADACTPGCGLLLSETFLDEDRRGPSRGLLQALSMSEGKQRSATEYSLLLKNYGLVTVHVRNTGNLLDAMLCIKV
ncbi:probable bifunctional dTTP/UTP pyrophosphatase/methyltransferase protein isoform X1 [Channa argus]